MERSLATTAPVKVLCRLWSELNDVQVKAPISVHHGQARRVFSEETMLSLMHTSCPELVVHLPISESGRCDRRELGFLVYC